MKNKKQMNAKCLWTTSLGYSITKSTLLVPLTFIMFEKTTRQNFDFVRLLSFFADQLNLKIVVCM